VRRRPVGVAEGSLFPTLTAAAVASTWRYGFLLGEDFHRQTVGLFQPTLNLNYLIFDFGQRSGSIQAAKAEMVAANFAFNDTHRKLIYLVTGGYYQLLNYANGRQQFAHSRERGSPFFVGRNGKKINMDTFRGASQQLRDHAGLHRTGGPRCQPRLHDMRHTSAVHRLTAWYREGKDVQLLLPQLPVYLGHTHLAATQVYLTMTPELLREASLRFELYGRGEGHHD
jgi:hypothetical protein